MSEDPSLASGFETATLEQWRALVDKVLKGADFERRMVARSADGLAVGPLYTRADALPEAADAAVMRGLAAGRTAITQLHVDPDPATLAGAICADAEGGVEGFTVRIAAPGQSGLAPDFRAIEAMLAAVPLDRVRISLDAGRNAIHAGLALATVAKARGFPHAVAGLGIDPLGVLARTGERWLLKADGSGFGLGLPWLTGGATTLLADARPYHEAGASEAQELAALAATVVAYLRGCEGEGLAPADALPRLSLGLALDADIFLGIAKLRAARRIVGRIAEACGAAEAVQRVRLSTSTSERMMTRRDPWVNMLRVTAGCAAALMGRASEVAVLPFTWPLGPPDAFARRIARNVGIVLREESSLDRIADPAGGAWGFEQLTDNLARKAWSIFQKWEAEGGMQAALTSGLVQDQIAAVAEARARDISTGRISVTGTSAFPVLGRDGVSVAPWPEVPVPSDANGTKRLVARRLAELFEQLRDAADAAPVPPRVYLASLGLQAEHGVRSTWVANFLAAGGIEAERSDGFTASGDAGMAFAQSGARIACICGTDQAYAELAEATAMALKGAGALRVYLAGRPDGEARTALEAAGVDGLLHVGCDAVAALTRLHRELGIS